MQTDGITNQSCRKGSTGLFFLPLIILPGLLLILFLKFFDGPGMGDKYGTILNFAYYGITAICSFGTAFGFVRLFSLVGFKKIIALIILTPILYCISLFGAFFVAALLFLPKC